MTDNRPHTEILTVPGERVAFGLRLVVGQLATVVLLLRQHFLEPLLQSRHCGLQTLTPERCILHLSAGFSNPVCC